MKKVIFVLGAIVVLVLLAGFVTQIKETYRNINEMNNEKQNCMEVVENLHNYIVIVVQSRER